MNDDTRWRSVAETAEHFGVSENFVRARCKNGWPHRRIGTHKNAPIKFCPVEDWPAIADLLRPAAQLAVRAPRRPPVSRIARGMSRLSAVQ